MSRRRAANRPDTRELARRAARRAEHQAAERGRRNGEAESLLPPAELLAARAVARRLRAPVFAVIDLPDDEEQWRAPDATAGGLPPRRLALEPPARGLELAYAVLPDGSAALGPGWPRPERPPTPSPDAAPAEPPAPTRRRAAREADAARQERRQRDLDRLERRAGELAGLARVDERAWAAVDRLLPDERRRELRTLQRGGASGDELAAAVRELVGELRAGGGEAWTGRES